MSLAPGARLGPYEVIAQIGAGGMGEVYRATDTKLKRHVAIKVLPESLATDPGRLARFQREAEVLASLSHPNIAHIHGLEDSDGTKALVMELVEGPTLADRLAQGPMPVDEALPIAKQIAEALEAAHEQSIVHRDLKPANIKVQPDGAVKVLDFGLAKAMQPAAPASSSASMSPTITTPAMTQAGLILGTAAYMSPEQAKGRTVDKRADIWAFGCVLYEMLAGRRAFDGDDISDTLANILKSEPQWTALPDDVPEEVRLLVRRCLEKDARARIADLGTARFLLTERIPQTAVPGPYGQRRRGLAFAAAMLAAGLAIGATLAVVLTPRSGDTGPDLSRYTFTPISLETPTEREPVWSPDGQSLAYTAAFNGVLQVMTRAVGSPQAAQLTHLTRSARAPFWSPDGSTIYYSSPPNAPGGSPGLWSVSPTGGTPDLVIEGATSAAIHPNGTTFAYAKDARLWVGNDPRAGGEPPREFGQPPFEPPGVVQGFSPDGSKLAVWKDGNVWVLDYPSGAARRFATSSTVGPVASWMPDSRRLVVSEMQAGSVNQSLSLLDVTSGERRLIFAGPLSLANPAVSPDGHRIAYMGGQVSWDLVEVQVPDGGVRTMPSAGGVSWFPAWAPAGTHYAFASVGGGNRTGIWDMSSAEEPGFQRLLVEVDAQSLSQVRWSPDGSRFSFVALRSTGPALMVANASGGRALAVEEAATTSIGGVWSPDGQWLAYQRRVGSDVQLVRIRPGSRPDPQVLKAWPLGRSSGEGRLPVDWSPDGNSILTARGSGGLFLMSPDGKTERALSAKRGGQGRATFGFSRDGRAVLYLEQNTTGTGAPWRLWSIDVATGAERLLADVPLPPTAGDAGGFSLHPDGTRFLTSIANWPFDIWMLEGFDQ